MPQQPQTPDIAEISAWQSSLAAILAATGVKVTHATLQNFKDFTPEKVNHVVRGGIREGAGRTGVEAQQMIDKIPASQRAGVDGQSAAQNAKDYLRGKDASHIEAHSKGGSGKPDNLLWEEHSPNAARGNRTMSNQEQQAIKFQGHVENWTGAVKAGVFAMPKGAAIGAATTIPFSLLRYSLAYTRGELSVAEAAQKTLGDTGQGAAVGAVSGLAVTTLAVACPPIAVALAVISPALLVAGGASMVHQFFSILDQHKDEVKQLYASLTDSELAHLRNLESELAYEHQKNLAFLAQSRETATLITDRPREAGVEGALQRFMATRALANTLDNDSTQKSALLPHEAIYLPITAE
jgi:hypothetical protein